MVSRILFADTRARYGFGEVRVATLALLIFTALSGWRSCGVVITKFSDHVVTFRSSPTFFADTPGACVRFNPHFGWQAAESYVERSNAFAIILGHRVLVDLSRVSRHAWLIWM